VRLRVGGRGAAEPIPDAARYREWANAGHAGDLRYLTDRRAAVREDPRNLLASARSLVCVGKLYQTPWPHTTQFHDEDRAWISRYAWGDDYHDVMRRGLERLAERLGAPAYKICVDTAPLLERSYARLAGLGWIGKNTCLINQQAARGSFSANYSPHSRLRPTLPRRIAAARAAAASTPVPPRRSCRTGSIRASAFRTSPSSSAAQCRKKCARASAATYSAATFARVSARGIAARGDGRPAFAPRQFAPRLADMAALTEPEFRAMFRGSPVTRARYSDSCAMWRSPWAIADSHNFARHWKKLAASEDPVVAEHARWALSLRTR